MERGDQLVGARSSFGLAALFAGVALVVAGLFWSAGYAGDRTVPVAVVLGLAAVLPLAVAVVAGTVTTLRFTAVLALSVVTYLVFALVVVVTPVMSVPALADGYVRALARFLTVSPPLPSDGGNLVPAATLLWVAGAVTGELLVRTRTRGLLVVAPALAALGGYVVATTEVTDSRSRDLLLSALLFVSLAAMALFRGLELSLGGSTLPETERRRLSRLPVLAGVVVAVALLATVVLVPRVESDQAATKVQRTPPIVDVSPDAPLAVMAAYRRANSFVQRNAPGDSALGRPLLRVTTSRASTGYFGIANLDVYDGAEWRFDRVFRPFGVRVPLPETTWEVVSQSYEVVEPLFSFDRWLVTLQQPVRLEGEAVGDAENQGPQSIDAAFDTASGMLISATPLTAGSTYSVDSEYPGDDQGRPVTLSSLDATLRIPGQPAYFTASTRLSAKQADIVGKWREAIEDDLGSLRGDIGSLQRLAGWFRDQFALLPDDDPETRRTLNLLTINEQLAVDGEVGAATPEQFSTLFVLLVRQLGIPARITTGFRLVDPAEPILDAGGPRDVAANSAWTWAEVYLGDGLGWLVVDPSPTTTDKASAATTTTVAGGSSDATLPPAAAKPIFANPTADPPPDPDEVSAFAQAGAWAAGVVALLALAMAPWLVRRLRRRSRGRGEPVARVQGAWHEVLDLAQDSGMTGVGAMGAAEFASRATSRFGEESSGDLMLITRSADEVVFSSAPVDVAAADQAWAAADHLSRQLRSRMGVAARLRFGLRSLHGWRRWR